MRKLARWLHQHLNEIIIAGCIFTLTVQANRPRLVVNVTEVTACPAPDSAEILDPPKGRKI